MNKKLLIFLLIIIFVFGYTVFEAMRLDSKFADAASLKTGTVIKSLPLVLFEQVESDEKFDPVKLAKAGNYVFVHFWATWCAPCEAEFPELVELIRSLRDKKNISFLLIAVNDDLKAMKKFLKKFDLNLDNIIILADNLDAHKQYGTYKMPESFLFAPNELIVKKFTGQQPWSQTYLVEYFNSL